jgi:uncharacterized membrane protein YcjF (UPF0283 family)
MRSGWRRLAGAVSVLLLLSFGLLVVNQTAGVVQLASTVDPRLGQATLVVLVGAYAILLIAPVVLFFRLRKPLRVPDESSGAEYEAYLEQLRQRLSRNPHLQGRTLATRADLESAIGELDARVDELVTARAGRVFLATAVSQSGRLDAFMVLGIQTHMVWEILHVYAQRPSAREMLQLYANVAVTAFIAGAIDEIDPAEQIAPIMSAALPTMAAELPGFRAAGSVFANSVVTGSANAFLTLRVGMVARRYAAPLTATPRGALRKAAIADAARLLGSVVATGSARLSRAIWDASRQTVGGTVSGAAGLAKGAGRKAMSIVGLGDKNSSETI